MSHSFTLTEIESQPEAWTEALAYLHEESRALDRFAPQSFDDVIFTGCGSTYYLALAAASLFQEANGVPARGLPASELWLYPHTYCSPDRNTLLVAISRSGTTTETVRAVRTFRDQASGSVITLSCYPHGELAGLGDLNLVLEAGQEQSIAQTRAFSVLYLATTFLANYLAGRSLDDLDLLQADCRRLIADYRPLAARFGRDLAIDRFYLLGSGPRYGLACELSLKLKEMTLSHSEPFHFLEFRHGPQSMVSESTLIIALVSEETGESERAVLRQMADRGAQILSLAQDNAHVILGSGTRESLRNPLYLPVIQLLAFERSLAKGLDPDRPQNLEAVVMLE